AGGIAEHGAAEGIGGEQAVQISAGDAAIGADGAFGSARNMGEGTGRIGAGGGAHMNVVAGNGGAGGCVDGVFDAELLDGGEGGFDIEQAEAGTGAGGAFDAIGIGNGAAKHLVAAANAQD